MIIAELHDGTELEFPDDMSDDEIERRVQEYMFGDGAASGVERRLAALAAQVTVLQDLVKEMIRAQLAPRKIVRDVVGRAIGAVSTHQSEFELQSEAATRGGSPFDRDYAHLQARPR